jgi:hypothetical protein
MRARIAQRMNEKSPDGLPNDAALPAGWVLLERMDGAGLTILEFQRGGRFGPRVTAAGVTFEQALAYGRDRMLLHDERDRQRGVL